MCGIAGIIDYQAPISGQTLQSLAAGLHVRGPDELRVWQGAHIGLVHTRLALQNAHDNPQPRHCHNGRYTVVFNGQIYNWQALRKELSAHWDFIGQSDTEVLLAAYVVWGARCLPRLNGMFAFAIWDAQTQSAFLARDRLGIKPLWFSQQAHGWCFASEAKNLLAADLVSRKVDTQAVLEYLVAPFFSGVERSMFAAIKPLPAGHYVRLDRLGMQKTSWWTMPAPEAISRRSSADTVFELQHLLRQAVARTHQADAHVGHFLSGGLDSSLIAALNPADVRPQHSYTIAFDGHEHFDYGQSRMIHSDDTVHACALAKQLGHDHTLVAINDCQLATDIQTLAQINDALPAWEQERAQHHLARVASRHCKAVLVGDAADEIHYGYSFLLDPHTRYDPSVLISQLGGAPIKSSCLPDAIQHFAEHYRDLAIAAGYRWTHSEDALLASHYLINHRWLQRLLHNGDVHTMVFGLEARLPFADIELMDFAYRLPTSMAVNLTLEKPLLRAAAYGLLPETIRQRPKSALPKAQNTQIAYQRILTQKLPKAADWYAEFLELSALKTLASQKILNENQRALVFRLIALADWADHYQVSL